MDHDVLNKSRLIDKHILEAEYRPLKWRTVLGWERDGIVTVIRLGRRCFLDRCQLDRLLDQGGQRFSNGWRRGPV